MPPLRLTDHGSKRDLHIALYDDDLKILGNLCQQYGASRAAIIGALLRDYAKDMDFTAKLPRAGKPGAQAQYRRKDK